MAGLFLTDLTLSHFRSHRRAVLALDGRPVALWGPNGAGKTNVLEAVSLLSPGRGLRRAGAEELARRPEAIGWKVSAVLRAGAAVHELETTAEDGQPRAVRIDGKAAPQAALARVCRVVWLVPSMDRLWIEAAEGRRRFLDRLVLSFAPHHAEAVLAYEKAMRERNRLLKDMVRDAGWYAALEAQMAEQGALIQGNRAAALARIAAAQAASDTAFPAADLALVGPRMPAIPRVRRRWPRPLPGPRPRPGRRAYTDRPAPRRSGRQLRRQGRACRAMFDRRAEGAADLADPRQCKGAGRGCRRAADPAAGRGGGAS
ncbi:recombination protein F [Frigidibacter mobilis]|uniref:DNA replication and repair protein RecF n=1 Tax=Frigidibacter mobilis TaxID=1335048 RepID=A0A159Z247_9RHOB|nr:recombination protein F [Frigidibacter mobilis]